MTSSGTAALCAALLLVSVGCDGDPSAAPETEGPVATEDCGAPQRIPVQGEGHLVGDQDPPVPYNSTPPTSGWHTSTDVPTVIASDEQPLSEPEQVTILEQGGVVITHNDLQPQAHDELERFVSDRYAGLVAVTPYAPLQPGEVALTAWGVLQRCEAVDLPAIEAFVEAYAQRDA